MNHETKKRILNALAEGRVVNTSNSFSVSDQSFVACGIEYGRLIIFPREDHQFFIESTISFFLSVADTFNVLLAIESRHGLPIVKFL